jgi:O-antigen ligase
MLAGLFGSLSRSGVIGLLAASAAWLALARRRRGRLSARWTGAAIGAMAVIAVYFANFDALAGRFARALERGTERAEVWRETLSMAADFPWSGVGLGAYSTAMLVYQQADRAFFFNQAHNQYLQVAAEGGLLVGLPTLLAVLAFWAVAWRRLAADRSALFWARAGAIAALTGVAVQGLWETGLRMPANGVLFAVVAALASHAPHREPAEEG